MEGDIIARVIQKKLVRHCAKLAEKDEEDFRLDNLRTIAYQEFKSGNLLDVGCGMGHMSLYALQRGHDVTAIDVSKKLLSILKKRSKKVKGGKLTPIYCSAEDLGRLGENKFDNIVSLDVLEHIKDDVMVIRNMHQLLKKDGHLVLAVPALKFLWGQRDITYYHYRRYSMDSLKRKLAENGFVIDKIRYWNFLGALLAIAKKASGVYFAEDAIRTSKHPIAKTLNYCLNTYFKVIENNIPMPLGLNLIVVARKKANQSDKF